MIEIKKISRQCNIRSYTYTAHVTKATGKLKKITAGCRTWATFDAAFEHYRTGKWGDLWVFSGNPVHRWEARSILDKLQMAVTDYQRACIRRKRK